MSSIDLTEIHRDLGLEPARPRSLFFEQPLIGESTRDVESLRSFVERLAFAHTVKPRALLEALFERYPLATPTGELHAILSRSNIHGAARVGSDLQERLHWATGTDLSASTLGRFRSLFAEMNLTRCRRRLHCLECVRSEADGCYGRLLWEVQSVVACPLHHVRLTPVDACGARADQRVRPSQRTALPGVCPQCGSVGFNCATLRPVRALQTEVWVADQVGRLLALASETMTAFSSDTLRSGLSKLLALAYGHSPVLAASKAGLSRASVWAWTTSTMRPSLSGLVQLCLHADCDVASLLAGEVVRLQSVSVLPFRLKVVPRTYRRAKVADIDIENALQLAAIEKEPPALSALARRLGVNEDAPRHRFVPQARRLAAANSSYLRALNARKFAEAVQAYADATTSLASKGKRIGVKQVQAEAKLVAFSRNRNRVRALASVLESFHSKTARSQ